MTNLGLIIIFYLNLGLIFFIGRGGGWGWGKGWMNLIFKPMTNPWPWWCGSKVGRFRFWLWLWLRLWFMEFGKRVMRNINGVGGAWGTRW